MKTVVNDTCVRCWNRWMTCGKVQVSCIYGQSLQIALSISLMLGCVCWSFWAESGVGYLKVIDNDQNMLPILDNIPFPSICPIYEIWTKYGTVPSQSMSMNNISIFRISTSWVRSGRYCSFQRECKDATQIWISPSSGAPGPWCSEGSTRLQGRTWKNPWQELPRGSSTGWKGGVTNKPAMAETTNDLGDKTNQDYIQDVCFACKNGNESVHDGRWWEL